MPDNLKTKILQFIQSNNIPNLILTGSPGIGKTTTIRCVANGLYDKYYKTSVLELNASDDRGIKSVQGDIINFCKSVKSYKRHDIDKYCKQKLIILDEADNMMDKAQHQINTLMEKYKDTVRFAFTCNSSCDIIEAIQSRCIILRYCRLDNLQLTNRLEEICNKEHSKFETKALQYIAEISRGDMRGAINTLQLIYNKHGSIKYKYVQNICDLPTPVLIKTIFLNCINNDLKNALKIMLKLKTDGYSGSDITLAMIYTLKSDLCVELEEILKHKILEKVCYAAYYISKGVDSNLQLASCLSEISLIK